MNKLFKDYANQIIEGIVKKQKRCEAGGLRKFVTKLIQQITNSLFQWIVNLVFMKNKVKRLSNSSKRQDQLEAGLFDGRYRQKVVVDKKKKQSRNWARKNK